VRISPYCSTCLLATQKYCRYTNAKIMHDITALPRFNKVGLDVVADLVGLELSVMAQLKHKLPTVQYSKKKFK